MGDKVFLTTRALNDLQGMVEFVAARSPAAAEKTGHGIVAMAESLASMPRRGSLVRDRPGVRKVRYGRH